MRPYVRRRARVTHPGSARDRLWYRLYRRRIRDGLERCRHCDSPGGRRNKLTFDHLKPWSLGYGLNFDNVTILCERCQQRKAAKVWPHLVPLAAEEATRPPYERWYEIAAAEVEAYKPHGLCAGCAQWLLVFQRCGGDYLMTRHSGCSGSERPAVRVVHAEPVAVAS